MPNLPTALITPTERLKLAAMYVDASLFDVRVYGAKVDGVWLYDATMVNGSSTLTSASAAFTSADVGKIVFLGCYVHESATPAIIQQSVGTITGYTDAHNVTVSFSASATIPGTNHVSVVCYGTNDLTAVRNAQLAAEAANGGVVYFPAGTCVIWSAAAGFATADNHNALVPIASVIDPDDGGTATNRRRFIEWRGAYGGGIPTLPLGGVWPDTSGTVIFAPVLDITGLTFPSILGATRTITGPLSFQSMVQLRTEGLHFRTPANPLLACIDAYRIGGMEASHTTCDVACITFDSPQPTHATGIAFIMPADNNFADSRLTNSYAAGYYTGATVAEHFIADNFYTQCCFHGIDYNTTGYEGIMHEVLFSGCPHGLVCTGTGVNRIKIEHLIVETTSSLNPLTAPCQWPTWCNEVYTIDDAGNYLHGEITFHCNSAGLGDYDTFVVNGGTNLLLRPLYDVGRVVISALTSTETVSLSAGVQVATNLKVPIESVGDYEISACFMVYLTGCSGAVNLSCIFTDTSAGLSVTNSWQMIVNETSCPSTIYRTVTIPPMPYRQHTGSRASPPNYMALMLELQGNGTVGACYLVGGDYANGTAWMRRATR